MVTLDNIIAFGNIIKTIKLPVYRGLKRNGLNRVPI